MSKETLIILHTPYVIMAFSYRVILVIEITTLGVAIFFDVIKGISMDPRMILALDNDLANIDIFLHMRDLL